MGLIQYFKSTILVKMYGPQHSILQNTILVKIYGPQHTILQTQF